VNSTVGAAESESMDGTRGQAKAMSRRQWAAAAISILIVGSVLRVHHLELVPLHHDEGVNGFFLTGLFRTLTYRYNPENYHGPSLYYFALVPSYLLGLNTLAIRITTAVFGIATIWLILGLRRHLGDVGSLVGASLLAVSPGAVYLSRYFIHETLFVFFTLGVVAGLLRYRRDKRPTYLILAASSASLLFATKETAIITAAVLLFAAVITETYILIRRRPVSNAPQPATDPAEGLTPSLAETDMGTYHETSPDLNIVSSRGSRALDWGSAGAIAILLFLLFYSSFFVNPRGIVDAAKAFKFWARTGEQQHTHGWNAYLGWLWQQEAPLLLLTSLGAGISIWVAKSKVGVFASLWALGVLAAYSLIPYKTPWLGLNFIVPMAVAVACAADGVFSRLSTPKRTAAAILLVGALSISVVQCIRLNFYHYDDERYAYVYAHTQREFLGLVSDIEAAADRAGTGKTTAIAVTSPDYWPLPWYLRSYVGVGYYGDVRDSGAPIVVGSEGQQQQLDGILGEQYVRAGLYALRPGVVLVLYTRRELAPPENSVLDGKS
jgi:uncharacterized protein (TIGR03663 family)